MDWMDFILKFSSELLILIISLTVAGLNFFSFGNGSTFNDQSLAGAYLSMHRGLNPTVYNKNSSIVTEINNSSLLPFAQAEDFSGLDSQGMAGGGATDQTDGSSIVMSDDNSILAPNPDSITDQVSNVTKKVYTTQPGDTLKSISESNNISINSIKWSNPSLSGDTLKPGWDLIIPPVDGVAVTVENDNITLPDLAVKYNPQKYNTDKKVRDAAAAQLLDQIITFNGLGSAENINGGDFLIIPGGAVEQAPAPAPKPKPKTSPKSSGPDNSINDVTSISSGYDDVNHFFPVGYCTYYVAHRMKITFGGNAKNWLPNAKASGYVTGQEPAVHSAVVFAGSSRVMRRYGHVAYVEEVSGGQILVSEMNYDHFNRVDQRWIPINDPSIRGYIYP